MTQDSDSSLDLEAKLERYKRLLDPLLDAMTFENIRALVKEIGDQIAAGKE